MGHRIGRIGRLGGSRRGRAGLAPMGRIVSCFMFSCYIVVAVALSGGPAFAITSQEFVKRAHLQQQKGSLRGAIIELKNALQKNRNNAAATSPTDYLTRPCVAALF